MSLNRTFFHVDVSETERDRNYWASRADLAPTTVASIRSAEILLVPWDRGKGDLSFPVGTTDFFRTLSQRLGNGKVAIAADRSHYQELALHGNELRWPSMIVSGVLISTLANVLSDEIEKLISSSAPPTTIEMTVTVENERGKCISIGYKGPPNRLVETLVQESARCLPHEPEARSQTKPAAQREEEARIGKGAAPKGKKK